jgi:hypothetical protein
MDELSVAIAPGLEIEATDMTIPTNTSADIVQ